MKNKLTSSQIAIMVAAGLTASTATTQTPPVTPTKNATNGNELNPTMKNDGTEYNGQGFFDNKIKGPRNPASGTPAAALAASATVPTQAVTSTMDDDNLLLKNYVPRNYAPRPELPQEIVGSKEAFENTSKTLEPPLKKEVLSETQNNNVKKAALLQPAEEVLSVAKPKVKSTTAKAIKKNTKGVKKESVLTKGMVAAPIKVEEVGKNDPMVLPPEAIGATANDPIVITEVVQISTINTNAPTKPELESIPLPTPPAPPVVAVAPPPPVPLAALKAPALEDVVAATQLPSQSMPVATSAPVVPQTKLASTSLNTLPDLPELKGLQAVAVNVQQVASPKKKVAVAPQVKKVKAPVVATTPPPITVAPTPVIAEVTPPVKAVDTTQTVLMDTPVVAPVNPIASTITPREHRVANPKFPGLADTGDFITFAPGSSHVSQETVDILRQMVGVFKEHGIRKIVLTGTALRDEDSEGMEFSDFAKKRAENLRKAFQQAGFKGIIALDDPKRAKPGSTPRVGLVALR